MSSGKIALPAILEMAYAEPLRLQLIQEISIGGSLEIDAHDVSEVSTPCLQVLIAAATKIKNFNGAFKILNPSSTLSSAFYDLGLGEFLNSEG